MRVIPDSPAAKAGLIPGDRIVALNDERIAQIGMVAARRLLQRSENITLSLLHPDGRTSSLALERGDFNDSGVLPGRMIAQGIGLIRLARFRDGRDAESSPTVIAFRKEIELLRADGLQGLILDLRGNGGGSVIAAVAIADAFLNAGHDEPRVITTQISRNPARNHVYVARSNTTLPDWPLVVLIDRYTASSAEIVAAALKDHRRAALVGERSFGKNSIQELFVLDNGAALLLTVAHFRSPDELTFSGHGILPQVQLECDPVLRWRLDRRQFLLDQGLEVPAELQPLRDPIIEMATNMLTAAIIQVSH
jgi:carboxyl-terminal processing protease